MHLAISYSLFPPFFLSQTTLMNTSSTPTRRPCFIDEDNGLTSNANSNNMETPTFSGHHFISRPLYHAPSLTRRGSLRNMSNSYSSMSSPRSGRFYEGRFEEQLPHFLDSCFLCKKPIGGNRDIFMYRGDTPFCSEECREEQIERDESKEKKWNLKASMKAFRNKEQKEKSSSPNTNAQEYSFHSGAVAAAS